MVWVWALCYMLDDGTLLAYSALTSPQPSAMKITQKIKNHLKADQESGLALFTGRHEGFSVISEKLEYSRQSNYDSKNIHSKR